MKEEDIVKKVCEIMRVKYSHYDNHNMSLDYFEPMKLESKPKIVIYSLKYGHWEIAILEDMSVITPTYNFTKTMKTCVKRLLELGDNGDDTKKTLKDLEILEKITSDAEKFLKDNNCASIINDETKKINWV